MVYNYNCLIRMLITIKQMQSASLVADLKNMLTRAHLQAAEICGMRSLNVFVLVPFNLSQKWVSYWASC